MKCPKCSNTENWINNKTIYNKTFYICKNYGKVIDKKYNIIQKLVIHFKNTLNSNKPF